MAGRVPGVSIHTEPRGHRTRVGVLGTAYPQRFFEGGTAYWRFTTDVSQATGRFVDGTDGIGILIGASTGLNAEMYGDRTVSITGPLSPPSAPSNLTVGIL